MSAFLQIVMALGSVAILLGAMALIRQHAAAHDISPELQRKLIHIGTGLYALTLPWLFSDRWPVYLLLAVTLAVMLVLRLPRIATLGLGATLHSVERQSWGDILLAVAVGMCLFLSGDQPYLYVLPIAVLTLADAAAALAGSNYGRKFFVVEEGRKSIEGSVVFFTLTFLISLICLMLMTPLAAVNMLLISAMVAGFGTMVEATSWQGFDNLFLPVGLLIFLSTHANKDPLSLTLLAVGFAISVIAFLSVARPLGLTRHSARVYVIAVFLLLAVTSFQNALIPILVLLVHVWSRSANPGTARFPDLDIVAAVALISFGSLVLGPVAGHNTIPFYIVTTMGLATGLAALALQPHPVWLRVSGLVAIIAGLCALRYWTLAASPPATNWAGPFWGTALASLALTALVPCLFPQSFRDLRIRKLSALALIVPLPAYLHAISTVGG
ncbi:diacylglycerol/polyprenol kinase family protein [Paracoccus sp. (in: a-proteobacteria)]|uniref:diacylglycerol/polyprenol kinase family protein n=1 Tax=Paracoccus sp. TaxID=267 RepID=UPI003A8B7A42